jgi:hypothetical protein
MIAKQSSLQELHPLVPDAETLFPLEMTNCWSERPRNREAEVTMIHKGAQMSAERSPSVINALLPVKILGMDGLGRLVPNQEAAWKRRYSSSSAFRRVHASR